uniref:Uncharacterized protein n=1 Tax=Anguilla anguilla TaxID=7936 RepID=A0A0E9XQ91_ANGAN
MHKAWLTRPVKGYSVLPFLLWEHYFNHQINSTFVQIINISQLCFFMFQGGKSR